MNTTSNNWNKSWIAGVVLALVILLGGEYWLRSVGYFPNVLDNKTLWAHTRQKANENDGKVIALLGDSRMLYNIDTSALKKQFPGYQVAQLAICAKGPMAALKDLANDSSFKGTVLCAVSCDRMRAANWGDQQNYVDYFHQKNGTAVDNINQKMELYFQSHSAIVRSEKRLLGIVRGLKRHHSIGKPHTHTFADRSSAVDLSSYAEKDMLSMVLMRQSRAKRAVKITPEEWLKEIMTTEPLVQKIHARGGRVIFLRMPTTKEYLAVEYQQYPKSDYWDKFEAATSAETIHFEDVAAMKTFILPDRSHINMPDRTRFTNVLSVAMKQKNVGTNLQPNRIARKKKKANSSRIH